MLPKSFWVPHPTSKKKSVTLTMFVYGAIVCFAKLIFSGVQVGNLFTLSQFSGVDFGAAMGALGGIYAMRRTKNAKEEESTEEKEEA